MKLNIYIMHSEKRDYKNEIYKPLLEKGLLNKYFLILPLSEKFSGIYMKDVLNDSDIIICDLTNFNIFSNYELKMAQKLNKTIYYFIREDDKKIKKYKDINFSIYKDSEDYVKLVSELLDSLNQKELLLKRDNIYCLGKIIKNKYN